MREILFRGKRKDNGEWIEGYLVPVLENTHQKGWAIISAEGVNFDELNGYRPDFTLEEVDEDTIGQYTGVNDPNGQKIFEGDIVVSELSGMTTEQEIRLPPCPVVFERGCFGLQETYGFGTFWIFSSPPIEMHIVGNIYDKQQKEDE